MRFWFDRLDPVAAAMTLQCIVEAIDQGLAFKRLGQEADRPGFKNSGAGPFLEKGCNENSGYLPALSDQFALQIYSAHTRHSHIHNQASSLADMGG